LPEQRPLVNFNTREAVAAAFAASGWITWTDGKGSASA